MERAKFARVDNLLAALSCPVCFETVKDCVITPCGHSFCRQCAGDAVSRKHVCPVCQGAVVGGEVALIRNFVVDEATQALHKATEDTDMAYMRLLFANASSAGTPTAAMPPKPPLPQQTWLPMLAPGTGQGLPTNGVNHLPASNFMSPIEAVFVNRMRDAFLGYQSYYAREHAAHEAEVKSLTAKLETRQRQVLMAHGSDTAAGDPENARSEVQMLRMAIEESKRRFAVCMEELLKDFDAHAGAAAPPPSLLPATVTVIVASRGVRFDTQVLPTHFPANIYDKVRAFFAALGDEVQGFGDGTRLCLQTLSATKGNGAANPPNDARTITVDSATSTVFAQSPGGRIGAGWALIVEGAVLLASEEIKPCFATEYGKPGRDPEQRVDYFACGQCKLNWVCAPCATHCHRDCKDVRPFAMNHMPSWGCCYCSKKKLKSGCKLAEERPMERKM